MVATSSRWLRTLCATALCMAAHAAWANTNEQFAAQVRAHRQTMAQNPSAVGEAALQCTQLAPHRAMDEPRCVAWRLHVRALSEKQRAETCDTAELSAINHLRRCLLGGLPGSAA